MAENSKSALAAQHDRQVRLLEAELARTTERFRLAKFTAKEAKADAKAAKKEMKRARKAVIEAQDARESAAIATAPAKKKRAGTRARAGAATLQPQRAAVEPAVDVKT